MGIAALMIGYCFAQSILYSYAVMAPLWTWIVLTFVEGCFGNYQIGMFGGLASQADICPDKDELTMRMNFTAFARSVGAALGAHRHTHRLLIAIQFRLLYDSVVERFDRLGYVGSSGKYNNFYRVHLHLLLGAYDSTEDVRASQKSMGDRYGWFDVVCTNYTRQNAFRRTTSR